VKKLSAQSRPSVTSTGHFEKSPSAAIQPGHAITDRLNYCSSPINNMGWHMTVEKLIGCELPKRAQYMRVIIMELARIADHLVCDTVIGVDTGALTGFHLHVSGARADL
jgi:NADH-quinone oxidoreductase subunit D